MELINNLKNKIDDAIELSENLKSALTDLKVGSANQEPREFVNPLQGWPGMSSPKGRHLFNNICRQIGSVQPVKYLEVGTWAGSTLLSFLYDQSNLKYVSAVDNFTQFQNDFNVRETLELGVKGLVAKGKPISIKKKGQWWDDESPTGYEINFSNDHLKFQFLESHCFELDKQRLFGSYNVYFFDGPHSYEDTKKGFTYYNDVLEDVFVVIIDDWSRDYIQKAWNDVSKELNYKIHYEKELFGEGGANKNPNYRLDWWDGYYIGIVEKVNK